MTLISQVAAYHLTKSSMQKICSDHSYHTATSQPTEKRNALRVVFGIKNMVGQWSNPRKRRVCRTWFFLDWNAIDTQLTRALSKNPTLPHVTWPLLVRFSHAICVFSACFLSKTLDKIACLCYDISCKWQVFICSDQIFRGIAQLVEQRSPNVNRNLISLMITGFLRLETSVSSLFSCL